MESMWVQMAREVVPMFVTVAVALAVVGLPLGLRFFRVRERELELSAEMHKAGHSDRVKILEGRVQALEQMVGVIAQVAGRAQVSPVVVREGERAMLEGPATSESVSAEPLVPGRRSHS